MCAGYVKTINILSPTAPTVRSTNENGKTYTRPCAQITRTVNLPDVPLLLQSCTSDSLLGEHIEQARYYRVRYKRTRCAFAVAELYKRELDEDIDDHVSGDFKRVLTGLAQGRRSEDQVVDQQQVDVDARELYEVSSLEELVIVASCFCLTVQRMSVN